MCRNSVVNVIEIEKESISTTVTTCLRPYENQALMITRLLQVDFQNVLSTSLMQVFSTTCEKSTKIGSNWMKFDRV